MTVVVLTSGTTWTVPGDFNTSSNTVEVYGAGGGGGGGNARDPNSGGGGGGGAYSASSNFNVSGTVNIQIGTAGTAGNGVSNPTTAGGTGGDTWFVSSGTLLAKGGVGGQPGIGTGAGGAGGASGSGVGTTKTSGGAGGSGNTGGFNGGGGGGCGGSAGNGVAGSNPVGSNGGNGGAGDNGSGGAGGTGGTGNGPAGTANQLGGGGGAGGGNGNPAAGGAGGLPGGGGGGGSANNGAAANNGGTGGGGQIVITYTPVLAQIPSAVYEVPLGSIRRPRQPGAKDGDRWDYNGWQEAPLAADGPPTPALGFTTELPYNKRASQWSRHSMQGWQESPLSDNLAFPPTPQPVYEVPWGVKRHSYAGFFLSLPNNPDFVMPPTPMVDVPLGRITKHGYLGWQQWGPVPSIDPPLQSSRSYDLPMLSRAKAWARQEAYVGITNSPAPPSVSPVTHIMWLPLLGVGNDGP